MVRALQEAEGRTGSYMARRPTLSTGSIGGSPYRQMAPELLEHTQTYGLLFPSPEDRLSTLRSVSNEIRCPVSWPWDGLRRRGCCRLGSPACTRHVPMVF